MGFYISKSSKIISILYLYQAFKHINMETKRSCQLKASLGLLVSLLFEKSLLEIKTLIEKSSLLFYYINADHCILNIRFQN